MPNIQLSKNLISLRNSRSCTQKQLSTILNISRQAYCNYENGKRTPDLDTLIHLTQIYSVTLDQLIYQNMGNLIAEENGPYRKGLNITTGDTIYLSESEISILTNYRELSAENKKIIGSFFSSQIKK